MRTLIFLFLCGLFYQKCSAQTVMYSNGTYGTVTDTGLVAIKQPADIRFDWQEIDKLENAGKLNVVDTPASSARFYTSSYPFFFRNYSIRDREYRMETNEISLSQQAINERLDTSRAAFWLLFTITVASILGIILVLQTSFLSFFATGTSIIVGMWLSHLLGWWGFGIGLVISVIASLWNRQYADIWDYDNCWTEYMGGVIFGLLRALFPCAIMLAEWDDTESKMAFGWAFSGFIAIVWLMIAAIRLAIQRNREKRVPATASI